jgi:hypothetical protein
MQVPPLVTTRSCLATLVRPSNTTSSEARSDTRTRRPIRWAGTEYFAIRTVTMADRSTRGFSTRPGSNTSTGSGLRRGRSSARSWPMVRIRPGHPALVVLVLPLPDPRVELGQRLHLRHRGQAVAAEPANLTLDAALFVRAGDAWLAVERVEPVVRPEQHPARVPRRRRSPPCSTVVTAEVRLS